MANGKESGGLVLQRALAHQFENTLTGILDVVQDLVEAFGAAVIGIGHRGFLEFVREAHQQHELVLVDLGALLLQRGKVFPVHGDRKSTRLNSSHVKISYAVFCLKKKTNKTK